MKKYQTIKTLSLAAALGFSFAGLASASAWGPERTTFTMEKPASYPTFNSITNNPTIGDERDFVRVGEIDAKVTDLKNEVEVVPGRQYLVYVYFHNNASSTYNDKAHNNVGVALKTRMSSSFSTVQPRWISRTRRSWRERKARTASSSTTRPTSRSGKERSASAPSTATSASSPTGSTRCLPAISWPLSSLLLITRGRFR